MIFSNKHVIATAVALTLTAPAFAGASLDSLIGGGSVLSDNGTLVFSDFQFTPTTNAPSAADIEVIAMDNGLLFGTPIFTDSTTGIIDFDVAYKVTGVDTQIQSVASESTGSSTSDGSASVEKTILDAANTELASLTNLFSDGATVSTGTAAFAPQDAVYVTDEFIGNPSNGSSELSQTQQTFETTKELTLSPETTPTAIPSPTAAIAGIVLLGAMGIRRRRSA